MKTINLIKSILALIAISTFTIFFSSCEKENLDELPTSDIVELESPKSGIINLENLKTDIQELKIPQIDFPIVNKDVLEFRDVEHFETVYEELNRLYDEDDQAFNRAIEDLGINSVYNKLSNQTFADPKDRYQPFLKDPVMMSLVNPHLEFQVSKVLHSYISDNVLLTSDIDDVETRGKVRAMKKGARVNMNSIPEKAYPINDTKGFVSLLGPWGANYDKKLVDLSNSNNLKSIPCVLDIQETGWLWTEGNNGVSMSYRTATYYSWGYTYEEAKIYGYKFQGGVWQNVNSYIGAKVHPERRRPYYCYYNGYEIEMKDGYSKNKRARVNRKGRWGHSFIIGEYGILDPVSLELTEAAANL